MSNFKCLAYQLIAAKSMGFTVSMRTLDDGKIKVWKQEAIEDNE